MVANIGGENVFDQRDRSVGDFCVNLFGLVHGVDFRLEIPVASVPAVVCCAEVFDLRLEGTPLVFVNAIGQLSVELKVNVVEIEHLLVQLVVVIHFLVESLLQSRSRV